MSCLGTLNTNRKSQWACSCHLATVAGGGAAAIETALLGGDAREFAQTFDLLALERLGFADQRVGLGQGLIEGVTLGAVGLLEGTALGVVALALGGGDRLFDAGMLGLQGFQLAADHHQHLAVLLLLLIDLDQAVLGVLGLGVGDVAPALGVAACLL